jgi:hypothetical protein
MAQKVARFRFLLWVVVFPKEKSMIAVFTFEAAGVKSAWTGLATAWDDLCGHGTRRPIAYAQI